MAQLKRLPLSQPAPRTGPQASVHSDASAYDRAKCPEIHPSASRMSSPTSTHCPPRTWSGHCTWSAQDARLVRASCIAMSAA
eukprot:scaffold1924_cov248-Prasinococcus_capsulatus_cf.AAC.1